MILDMLKLICCIEAGSYLARISLTTQAQSREALQKNVEALANNKCDRAEALMQT